MNLDTNKIISTYAIGLQPIYKNYSSVVGDLLASILKANGIVPHSITNREKSPSSLRGKIIRDTKNYEDPLSEITDLAGVRIITYFTEDVDKIVPLIEKEFNVDQINSIDKRKKSDPSIFGYVSVHLIVELADNRKALHEYSAYKGLKCEIQVRTILQHAWAEIEHDIVYKSSEEIPFELRRRFASLAGLLEVADREFEQLRKDEIKVRKQIEINILNDDYEIPINRDSLITYLVKIKKENVIKSKKIKNEKIAFSKISGLIKMLSELKIDTIQKLDKILSEKVVEEASNELKNFDPKCPIVENCLLKYFIAIGNATNLDKNKICLYARCPEIDKVYNPELYEKRMNGKPSREKKIDSENRKETDKTKTNKTRHTTSGNILGGSDKQLEG